MADKVEMLPQEFKFQIENCVKFAKAQGLSDAAIYLEFLEQVRFMTTKIMLQVVV